MQSCVFLMAVFLWRTNNKQEFFPRLAPFTLTSQSKVFSTGNLSIFNIASLRKFIYDLLHVLWLSKRQIDTSFPVRKQQELNTTLTRKQTVTHSLNSDHVGKIVSENLGVSKANLYLGTTVSLIWSQIKNICRCFWKTRLFCLRNMFPRQLTGKH